MGARREACFWAGGAAVLAAMAFEAWLGRRFVYGEGHASRPILVFVAVHLAAFIPYAVAVRAAARGHVPRGGARAAAALAIALLCRAVFLLSSPIQEDDFYRYLWDGQVALAGVDPYRYSPAEARAAGTDDPDPALATLARLRESAPEASGVLSRVNHPQYSTIYPPVSIAVFAASQRLAPWSLPGLRLALGLFDLGTMLLLLLVLGRLGRPPALVVAYAWCPLAIKEIANSAHGDSIPAFFVVAALAAVLHARPVTAAASLATAALAKAYPLALAPILFAWIARRGARAALGALAASAAVCAAAALAIGWPRALPHSGFSAYAREWHQNSLVYEGLAAVLSGPSARWTVAAAALAVVTALSVRAARSVDAETVPRAFGVAVAAIFLLSPAQFPWYFVWVLPFVALFPSGPWLLLAASSSLYYLRFWIEYHPAALGADAARIAWRAILALEYLPFYAWLAVRAAAARGR